MTGSGDFGILLMHCTLLWTSKPESDWLDSLLVLASSQAKLPIEALDHVDELSINRLAYTYTPPLQCNNVVAYPTCNCWLGLTR